jgi:hypothetical protein
MRPGMRPVPEYDPRAWLLKALRETAHAIEALIWDLDENVHEHAPGMDEWSVRDLAHHMCETERRYVDRLERITRLEQPRVAAFDADSIEPRAAYLGMSAHELTDEFGVLRQQSVYLLWSLDDDDWQRAGIHPYLGPLTILQTAREMNEHDLSHLWQLRRLCDRFAATSV